MYQNFDTLLNGKNYPVIKSKDGTELEWEKVLHKF